jgi:thioredoxin reductase
VQEQRWAYLAATGDPGHVLPFLLMLRGWTDHVTLFTGGMLDLPAQARSQLTAAGVRIETAPVARLVAREKRLHAVELANGTSVPCDALFSHPAQRQVELIRALGLALDDDGYVRTDAMTRETSVAGVYAAGDLTTRMQSAIIAAAAGMQAAAMINMELTSELATSGAL